MKIPEKFKVSVFKEEVKYYGVKTGVVGKIAKKHWQKIKVLNKRNI